MLDRSEGPEQLLEREEEGVGHNIRVVLATFEEVYVCQDGSACLKRLSELEDPMNPLLTIALIDVPSVDDPQALVVPSTHTVEKNEPNDLYGRHMLSHICSSIQQRTLSRLIVPVAILASTDAARSALEEEPSLLALSQCVPDSVRMVRYLDMGAADVLSHPLTVDRVQGLIIHAYRTYKDVSRDDTSSVLTRRNRKLSWIGVEEERPFAYLREAMVSGLMEGICTPESVNDSFDASDLRVDESRKAFVEHSVGHWSFSAHDFTSDELVFAARTMLQHALSVSELQKWRLTTDELTVFIMACRKAYNDFVLYHNFRHVVDVLQAIFFFLLKIGLLPPYQVEGCPEATPGNIVAAVLKPFDALTLLIAALGHDVGHPGVNNAFLVALNAPLAQLYNDRSVLEAFHCAAYSQILRRYWPQAFSDVQMRKLMITSILATDMGLHFKYMKDMQSLQEKMAAAQSTADGWVPKVTEENRDLVCGLLIKCADISNVARKYACAAQWARVLTDEFANQGAMEKELNLPTCLFGGPPDPNDFLKLAESQLGFMNIFARPLFEGVGVILPDMRFTLAELSTNRSIWQERIEAENSRKMSFARSHVPRGLGTPSDTDLLEQRDRLSPRMTEHDSRLGSRSLQGGNDQQRQKSNPSITMQPSDGSPVLTLDQSRTPSVSDVLTRSSANASPTFVHQGFPKDSNPDILEVNAEQRRHSSVYSRKEDDDASRTGSIDPTVSTTIFLPSQPSSAAQDVLSYSQPPSPVKSAESTVSHSHAGRSLPSARSQATSNTEGVPVSPSTRASSVEDSPKSDAETPQPPQLLTAENPYIHANRSEDFSFLKSDPNADFMVGRRKPQTMSVYGADVLAMAAAASPGKNSATSQITSSGGSDDGALSFGDHSLRSSRSQSRLKGLRFWKKKPDALP